VTNQIANCDTYSASFGILWQTCANENQSSKGACDAKTFAQLAELSKDFIKHEPRCYEYQRQEHDF
jgi:hypothetical protein